MPPATMPPKIIEHCQPRTPVANNLPLRHEPTAAPTKKGFMARLSKLQQSIFLTPAQSRAAAQAQLDVVNTVMAGERQALRESILALVSERTKTTKQAFEVKLTINRAALETMIGDDAAVHIALAVAKRIIEQHNKLKEKTKPKAP